MLSERLLRLMATRQEWHRGYRNPWWTTRLLRARLGRPRRGALLWSLRALEARGLVRRVAPTVWQVCDLVALPGGGVGRIVEL
ncbi:MAG TPA: hypothetical protein VNN07_03950 [Candidatus Tectomicrobia bacterium]|nr:hypothetical protein [Candidatus Tectomicrobia bacterium]